MILGKILNLCEPYSMPQFSHLWHEENNTHFVEIWGSINGMVCLEHLYIWNLWGAPKVLAGNDDTIISTSKHLIQFRCLCLLKKESSSALITSIVPNTVWANSRDHINTWWSTDVAQKPWWQPEIHTARHDDLDCESGPHAFLLTLSSDADLPSVTPNSG